MEKQSEPNQPSTADILEEVKKRQAARRQLESGSQRKIAILADRFVSWLAQHWLGVFNTLAFLYVGLPFLAPILMQLGARGMASIIYTIYSPLCHQLPQRSWFLFGPKVAYRLPELMALAGDDVVDAWASGFVGNGAVGYKVGICQRDTAIYGAIFLSGVVYGLLRRRRDVRPLPWWAYIGLGILPMGIDGGYQLVSYVLPVLFQNLSISPHETTPLLRVITGTLFGWATVWLAYPYIQETMDSVRRQSFEARDVRYAPPLSPDEGQATAQIRRHPRR